MRRRTWIPLFAGIVMMLAATVVAAPVPPPEDAGGPLLIDSPRSRACLRDAACLWPAFRVVSIEPDQGVSKFEGKAWLALYRYGRLDDGSSELTSLDRVMLRMSVIFVAAGADVGTADGDERGPAIRVFMAEDLKRERDAILASLSNASARAHVAGLLDRSSPRCWGNVGRLEPRGPTAGGFIGVEYHADRPDDPVPPACLRTFLAAAMGVMTAAPGGEVRTPLDPDEFGFDVGVSEADFVLMATLYDPAMRAGMTEEEARAVFPEAHTRALAKLDRLGRAEQPI